VDECKPLHDGDIDHVMLQFGKVGKDMFTMDFQFPMSALQAGAHTPPLLTSI
jgi:tubby-related protein 1